VSLFILWTIEVVPDKKKTYKTSTINNISPMLLLTKTHPMTSFRVCETMLPWVKFTPQNECGKQWKHREDLKCQQKAEFGRFQRLPVTRSRGNTRQAWMQCKGKKSKETVWLVNTHAWWKLSMEEEEGVGERKRKMRRSGRRNGESIIMQRERGVYLRNWKEGNWSACRVKAIIIFMTKGRMYQKWKKKKKNLGSEQVLQIGIRFLFLLSALKRRPWQWNARPNTEKKNIRDKGRSAQKENNIIVLYPFLMFRTYSSTRLEVNNKVVWYQLEEWQYFLWGGKIYVLRISFMVPGYEDILLLTGKNKLFGIWTYFSNLFLNVILISS